MKRSILVSLLVLTSVFAIVTVLPESVSAVTRYVGGAGPGNYTTIQTAVNAANPGDTVYVYGGIYRENIVVTKSVFLNGESRETTIIDGHNGPEGILFAANSATVSGFTITNGYPGIRIGAVDNCVVSSNIISNGYRGIDVFDTDGTVIVDNIISSNGYNGIELSTSGNAHVANNVVSSNERSGIYMDSSVGNTIENNFVSSNQWGIYLDSSSSNDIVGNTAWSNYYDRSPSWGSGIWLVSSSSNRIEGNTASSNYRTGIRLEESASNVLIGNKVSSNEYGIYLKLSSGNTMSGNQVSLNGYYGIYLESSSSNTMDQNSISSNDGDGISLRSSGNNTIFGNSISSNRYRGLDLYLSDSNRMYHNNIVGNRDQAYDDGANQWDDGYPSGGNYWSDYVGTDQFSGFDQNLPGSDGIGDSLYYIPVGSSVDHYPKVNPNVVPLSPPSQPQNLEATPADGQVTLTWDPPAYDGGSPILNYRVYRRIDYDNQAFLVQIGNVLTYTDENLTNGQTHSYWISARNQVGEGLETEDVYATPATVPGPPLGLAAMAESRLITLTWMPPSEDGGSQVTNFNIYRGITPGVGSLLAEVGYVQQYVDIGLTNGVTYHYTVSAINEVGEGAMSEEVSATPAAVLTVPSVPTRLTASAGDRRLTLTWDAPTDNGGSPITNYAVYKGPFSGGETFLVEIGNVLTFTETGLTNGQTYSYRISAKNAIGEGSKSDSVSAVPMAVPGPPIGLGVSAGNSLVTLTWIPPIDDGGSPVTHYSVYRGTSSGNETYLTTPGNILTYEDVGLTNGLTYYYQVTASNVVGEGEISSEVSARPSASHQNQMPSCAFISPSTGETVSDRHAVIGAATDSDGTIEFVEVRIGGGGWIEAIGTTSWSYDLDTTVFSNGQHTVYARSFDGTDYSALATVTFTISNAEERPPETPLHDQVWFWGLLILVVVTAVLLLLYLREKTKPKKPTTSRETEEEQAKGRRID
ncbi:MAG: right-handed parallel beta-helix repeat-containing protein [Candidatus Thermoplasmatota archaeon]|nr:right-handed parallel beta-helix repeat-containing protein [Candidatus Thermoplasmatota archaeon]